MRLILLNGSASSNNKGMKEEDEEKVALEIKGREKKGSSQGQG